MSELTKLQQNLREITLMQDEDIDYTDMPQWTSAQWARAVKGPYPEAVETLRARREAGPPASEAFWAAVKPIILTDAFRHWFTGSKGVTEEERPKVHFHAIASGGDDFYCSDGPVGTEYGGDFGKGFYFYTDPETTLTYGSPVDEESRSRVIPVYLRAVNPLVLCTGRDLKNLWTEAGGNNAWLAKTPKERAEYIQGLGYDSVLAHQWGQWVVYQPTQIRLAIGDNDNVDVAAVLAQSLLPDPA